MRQLRQQTPIPVGRVEATAFNHTGTGTGRGNPSLPHWVAEPSLLQTVALLTPNSIKARVPRSQQS